MDPGAYWKKSLETVTINDDDFKDRFDSVSSPSPATPSSMPRYPISPVNSPFSPTSTGMLLEEMLSDFEIWFCEIIRRFFYLDFAA